MMKPKNPRNRKPLIGMLMLLILLSLPATGFAAEKDDFFELPVADDFTPALQADGSPRYITAKEIENALKGQSLEFKKIFHNKRINRFIIPSHDWLKGFLATYGALLRVTNIRGEADTWDCENYSGLLNALTTVRIWKAGYYDTRGAIGWMSVNAKKSWAGIPAERHALMFAVTEEGIFVIEPQNGQTVHLEKYPNKAYIQEVYLF